MSLFGGNQPSDKYMQRRKGEDVDHHCWNPKATVNMCSPIFSCWWSHLWPENFLQSGSGCIGQSRTGSCSYGPDAMDLHIVYPCPRMGTQSKDRFSLCLCRSRKRRYRANVKMISSWLSSGLLLMIQMTCFLHLHHSERSKLAIDFRRNLECWRRCQI